MKNIILTKIVIILLVIQTGMISSIPLVLCFNEGGHIQFEIKKKSIHKHHIGKCSIKINKHNEISLKNKNKSGCDNCYDIPVLFKYTANIRINKSLLDQYYFFLNYAPILFEEKKFFKDIRVFNQSDLFCNIILQKMSFLI